MASIWYWSRFPALTLAINSNSLPCITVNKLIDDIKQCRKCTWACVCITCTFSGWNLLSRRSQNRASIKPACPPIALHITHQPKPGSRKWKMYVPLKRGCFLYRIMFGSGFLRVKVNANGASRHCNVKNVRYNFGTEGSKTENEPFRNDCHREPKKQLYTSLVVNLESIHDSTHEQALLSVHCKVFFSSPSSDSNRITGLSTSPLSPSVGFATGLLL